MNLSTSSKRFDARRRNYDALITVSSPSHPSWPIQMQHEALHGEWQEAGRRLKKIEAEPHADESIVGYCIGKDFFASEIEPLIQQLRSQPPFVLRCSF